MVEEINWLIDWYLQLCCVFSNSFKMSNVVSFPSLRRRLKFPGVEFLGTTPNCTKRKKHSSLCVYVLQKTSHKEISRLGRAGEARKMYQKTHYFKKNSTFSFPSLSSRLRVVPHCSSGIVERAKRERAWKLACVAADPCTRQNHLYSPKVLKRLQRRQVKITPREKRRQAPCHLFSRGVIFTRALVQLALLSLRKNGGLLVVYCHPALLKLPNVTQAPQWGRKAENESKKKMAAKRVFSIPRPQTTARIAWLA